MHFSDVKEMFDHYNINRRTNPQYLGSGTYGTVKTVIDRSGRQYAHKVYNRPFCYDTIREITTYLYLHKINKGHLVPKFYGYVFTTAYACILIEVGQCICDVPFTYNIVHGLIRTMLEFNSLGLIHRDLKPLNIIITNDNKVVFIDLGSTRHVSSLDITDASTSEICTYPYRPPELIFLQEERTDNQKLNDFSKFDMWSCAMTILDIIGSQYFVQNYSESDVSQRIVATFGHKKNIRVLSDLPDHNIDDIEILHVLDTMLQIDPQDRTCSYGLYHSPIIDQVFYLPRVNLSSARTMAFDYASSLTTRCDILFFTCYAADKYCTTFSVGYTERILEGAFHVVSMLIGYDNCNCTIETKAMILRIVHLLRSDIYELYGVILPLQVNFRELLKMYRENPTNLLRLTVKMQLLR